jgi:hypothetical protein
LATELNVVPNGVTIALRCPECEGLIETGLREPTVRELSNLQMAHNSVKHNPTPMEFVEFKFIDFQSGLAKYPDSIARDAMGIVMAIKKVDRTTLTPGERKRLVEILDLVLEKGLGLDPKELKKEE